MLEQKTLADIIQSKVSLGHPNPRGFVDVDCPMCNDRRERGGFKFDGESTGYSCWNCQEKFKYEEGTGKLSRKAREILEAFGITRDDLIEIRSALFSPPVEKDITLDNFTKVKLTTPEVAFPDRTRPLLSEGHEEFQEALLEYLIKRKIDPLKTTFYFSLSPKMLRRIIIPFWRDGKLIYWQARTIDDVKPRFLNCVVAKDAVMYGYDQLHSYETAPLFITEGVFNAILVDGMSIMGAVLNQAKIEILKKSKRRIIFVRDRDSQGDALSKQVLDNGWEITTVDNRVNDINESVQKFGLPYTALSLLKNARCPTNKLQSSTALNLWGLEDRLRGRK